MTLDYTILSLLRTHLHFEPLISCMRGVTALGDNGYVWIALALVLLFRPKSRRWGFAVLFVLAAGSLLGEGLLKHLVQRPRPFLQYAELAPLIPPPGGFSFPSNHTLSSFAAATVLWQYRRPPGAAALVLAGLIGFSRLYLCVHFPSDVLAGALLGVLAGVVTVKLARRRGLLPSVSEARP